MSRIAATFARLRDQKGTALIPYVTVGDRVSEDSVIGIIEVMKLMNSVRAGVAGTVVALLAVDGAAVDEGQPLVRIRREG